MKYIVTHRPSRGQRFIMPKGHDTLEDAIEDARIRWGDAILDYNSYVDVRIEKQVK